MSGVGNVAEGAGDARARRVLQVQRAGSAPRVVLTHMPERDHQPERRGRSWRNSVANGRDLTGRTLRQNPSLRRRVPEAVAEAYRLARRDASTEANLPVRTFPEACPYIGGGSSAAPTATTRTDPRRAGRASAHMQRGPAVEGAVLLARGRGHHRLGRAHGHDAQP